MSTLRTLIIAGTVLLFAACTRAASPDVGTLMCTDAPVDEHALLDRLAAMPISTWRYSGAPATRHLGPMAQDFHSAFGLGPSDRSYDPSDAHGVSLSAIKALYQRVQEQDRRISLLEAENVQLEAQRGH
jgi:hypothetical protein